MDRDAALAAIETYYEEEGEMTWMDGAGRIERTAPKEPPLTEADFGPRHYGIWSDQIGRWWWRYMKVFVTTSKAVAKAQLTMIFAGTEANSPQEDLEPWRVRCIEEWADE